MHFLPALQFRLVIGWRGERMVGGRSERFRTVIGMEESDCETQRGKQRMASFPFFPPHPLSESARNFMGHLLSFPALHFPSFIQYFFFFYWAKKVFCPCIGKRKEVTKLPLREGKEGKKRLFLHFFYLWNRFVLKALNFIEIQSAVRNSLGKPRVGPNWNNWSRRQTLTQIVRIWVGV